VTSDKRHVLFRVAGERFALPLESVREVVTPQPPFARVPRTPEAVRGAMNLRGRVVAVVDLADLVGLSHQPLTPGWGQVVVLERSWRGLGFLIEAVLGVESLDPPDRESEGAVVRGVSSVRGGAVTVLDPIALVGQSRALFGGR
jgi:purine-binding chemotaxis protein CheW